MANLEDDGGEINRLMAERRAAMNSAKKRFLETDHLDSDFSDTSDMADRAADLINAVIAMQPNEASAVVILANTYFEAIPQDRERFLRSLRALSA